MKRFLIFSLAVGFGWGLQAQVTERERPAEWKNLVEGARFMDRLQPMKGEMPMCGERIVCVRVW